MPLRFVRHLACVSWLIFASFSVHAADCEKFLIPDLMFPHLDQASEFAYLSTISSANFDAHKKNALLDQDLATHPERYHADNPVGLALPTAKAMLTSSENFAQFKAKRDELFREHHFAYPNDELATFFARSMQPRRADAYAKCTNASGFAANILRNERNFVELTLSWRPANGVNEAAISNVTASGGTLRGPAPTKLTTKDSKPLLFVRQLDKDFRFSGIVAGAPVTVFVPKYFTKADAAKSAAACAPAAKVVQAMYQQILQRAPTPAEVAQQSALLASGANSVRQLVENLVTGPEYAKKFIEGKSTEAALTGLYNRTLGREPDPNGLAYNTRIFDTGGYQKIALAFVEGREYTQRFGDWTVPDASPKMRFCAGK